MMILWGYFDDDDDYSKNDQKLTKVNLKNDRKIESKLTENLLKIQLNKNRNLTKN